MSHRPGNPFIIPADIQARADTIMAAARSRFGHDAFRMEEGDSSGGEQGGQEGGQSGQSGEQGAGGQSGSGGNAAGQAGEQTGQQGAGEWDGKVESLPEPVQKMIRDLRTENGQRRTALTAAEQRQQDVVKAFAKAAGIELPGDDEQPDPAKLTDQLTKTQQQARQAAVELAVFRTASKHQGDPDALLDSRTFLAKVTDLDPTAEDFAAKVDTAIKDAVTSNPKLKTGQAPGASSADHGAGGSGEQQKRTPKTLEQAVGSHYGT